MVNRNKDTVLKDLQTMVETIQMRDVDDKKRDGEACGSQRLSLNEP